MSRSRNAKARGAAGSSAETEQQTSDKPTASADGRVARFAVLCRVGYPLYQTRVFAVYDRPWQAEDVAERLARCGADAWHEPALPTDHSNRVRR